MDEACNPAETSIIDSVDTSSIIENKQLTREYWEKRMMAEMNGEPVDQLLIETGETTNGCLASKRINGNTKPYHPVSPSSNGISSPISSPRSTSSTPAVSSTPRSEKPSNGPFNHHHHLIHSPITKLGSDGESEASPECSLSPVEVDSLEGGSSSRNSSNSDRQCSPDYVNCTHEEEMDDEVVIVVPNNDPADDGNNDKIMVVNDDETGFRDSSGELSPDTGISMNESSPSQDLINSDSSELKTNKNVPTHRRTDSTSASPTIGSPPKSSLSTSSSATSSPSSPISSPVSCYTSSSSTTTSSSDLPVTKTASPSPKLTSPIGTTLPSADPQSTDSIEEEITHDDHHVTEPDSLEEFIKHENECAAESSVELTSSPPSFIDSLVDSGLSQPHEQPLITTSAETISFSSSPSPSSSSSSATLTYSLNGQNNQLIDSDLAEDLLLTVDCSVNHHQQPMINLISSPSSSSSEKLSSAISDKSDLKEESVTFKTVAESLIDASSDLNSVGITDRPTIIGQLTKPSDDNLIPLSRDETNIDANANLTPEEEPINFKTFEHSVTSSPGIVPQEKKRLPVEATQSAPVLGGSDPMLTSNKETSPSPRPLAGIVNKQTGKIVKPAACGVTKSSAESMIAEEIRQLKEREEELARMRATMSTQPTAPITVNSSTISGQRFNGSTSNLSGIGLVNHHHHHPSIKSTPSHCSSIDGKSSPALSDLSSCSVGTISNDSIDPAPSKPLSLEILSGKVTGLLSESPIEKEIRITREREAELKAQAQLTRCLSNSIVVTESNQPHTHSIKNLINSGSTDNNVTVSSTITSITNDRHSMGIHNPNNNPDHLSPGKVIPLNSTELSSPSQANLEGSVPSEQETIVTPHGNKLPLFKQNSCGAANAADIQKLLATTRIQQEIQEQTQRELALKATGSIKTISQERTDLKVPTNKLTELDKTSSTYSSITQVNLISMASPTPTTVTMTTTTTTTSSTTLVPSEPASTAKNNEISSSTGTTIITSPIKSSTGHLNGSIGTGNNLINGLSSTINPPMVNHSNQINNYSNQNHFYSTNLTNNSNVNMIIQSNHLKPSLTSSLSSPPSTMSTMPSMSNLSLSSTTSNCSSSSSSSSSSMITSTPSLITSSIRRTAFQPFMAKGLTKSISMHKFISSKGKTATSTGNPTSSPFYPLTSPAELYSGDLRPPVMIKGDKGFRRGSVSAESKIQEELKEMKAREEELRRQRARSMGLSQPNLNLIGRDDEEVDMDHNNDHLNHQQQPGNGQFDGSSNGLPGSGSAAGGGTVTVTVGPNGSLYSMDAGLKRTTSNPNISSDEDRKVCHQLGGSFKPRKNPLIAQWEKKIIKDNPV